MSFMKKQAFGFYITVLAIIAAIVGLAYYFINSHTVTFGNIALNQLTIVGSIVAIVLMVARVAMEQVKPGNPVVSIVSDVCCVITSVLLMCSTAVFICDRVNTVASVISFAQNAQSTADLQSVIVGVAAMAVATVLSIIASYLAVRRD
jgi:hypothetical protein